MMREENSNKTMRLSAHHLVNFMYRYKGFGEYEKELNESIERLYGKEFIKRFKEFYAMFIANPQLKVSVISEEDDICKFCPNFSSEVNICNSSIDRDDFVDRQAAIELGLEVGKAYLVSDIIKTFDIKLREKYHDRKQGS